MRVRIPPTPRKTARRRDGKRALAYPDRGPSGPRPLPEFGVIGRRLNSQALRGDVSDNGTYRAVRVALEAGEVGQVSAHGVSCLDRHVDRLAARSRRDLVGSACECEVVAVALGRRSELAARDQFVSLPHVDGEHGRQIVTRTRPVAGRSGARNGSHAMGRGAADERGAEDQDCRDRRSACTHGKHDHFDGALRSMVPTPDQRCER